MDVQFSSVQFSHSVVSDSLRPHELLHIRPPCPSLTLGVYSNSCPSSRWCHPAISSSVIPFSCPKIPPSIRVFYNESTLPMRWPKYWSFSFSICPSNEYLGLISFRIDWFDLLAVQGPSRVSPAPQFKSINSSVLCFPFSPTLTSIHDHWKTIALTTWTFVSKVISLLFNMLSRFVIVFLQRSKHLLILWLQSPSAVILEPNKIKFLTVSIFPHLPWSDGTRCNNPCFFN